MNNNKPDKEILDQAADWFAKLRSDQISSDDRSAFAAWLDISHQHQKAYDKIEAMWDSLEVLSDTTYNEQPQTSPPVSKDRILKNYTNNTRPIFGFRWSLAAIPAVCVIAISLTIGYLSNHTYKTSLGEQKTVFLDDGSVVHLNTNSAIDITLKEDQRLLSLKYGEALFEVAHDKSRPFIVTAGNVSVRAVGTAFNIYRSCSANENVVITVVNGKVQISEEVQALEMQDEIKHYLTASEQTFYNKKLGLSDKKEVNAKHITSWKDQKLIYDGTPLSKVLEDINRYTKDKITLGDSSLKAIEVSAVFKIQNQETILLSLEQAFGLTATRISDAAITLKKKQD